LQKWSSVLAGIAQAYAENCTFAQNPDRDNQQNLFKSVGENIAKSQEKEVDYYALIKNWFNGNRFYDFDSNTCTEDKHNECRQYLQVSHLFYSLLLLLLLYFSYFKKNVCRWFWQKL